ncbi:hypothetical protein FGADI_12324 [Fusarium gaditjirri]|uniref:HAT C-terminal dimerisation domain-containing protein n=1 Tax=Fusarium gaditjirri TaxID=282569 RepID=A0A8H4WNX4_9HYPO|nr:hypothetical protein FGADI_12324 [Fusarium gaditjirri]
MKYWGMFYWMVEDVRNQYRNVLDTMRAVVNLQERATQSSFLQYGDWFNRYPHGLSDAKFMNPATHQRKDLGADGILEAKPELQSVEEYFSTLPTPQSAEHKDTIRAIHRRPSAPQLPSKTGVQFLKPSVAIGISQLELDKPLDGFWLMVTMFKPKLPAPNGAHPVGFAANVPNTKSTNQKPMSRRIPGTLKLTSAKHTVKRKRDDLHDELVTRFNKATSQSLLVQWITDANLSFRLSEHVRLHGLFDYLNPLVLVTEVLEEFELVQHNGYLVLDNASNNDNAVEELGRRFEWQEPAARRIRCFRHVLHLVATAMLFVHDAQALEDLDPDGFDEWTKRGPVGELHNLVVWINRSNKATVILRRLQGDDPDKNYPGTLDVVLDNCIRWLSQYYMIERAIKLRRYLEELVDITIQSNRNSLPSCLEEDNILTDADLEALNWFSNILAMFNSCLLRLEGDCQVRLRKGGAEAQYGMVWQVAIAYEFLLSTLERAKTESADRPESSYLSACINSAAYSGREGWIDKARYLIQTLWEEEYRDLPAQWEIADSNLPVAVSAREYTPFLIARRAYVISNSEEESVADEFERWQSTKQDTFSKHDNPLEYWSAKRFEYPRVAKMAIDVLSVPAMAAECERAFPSAGSMVSPQRTRLDASTIAVTQTVRSWLKAGLLGGYDGLLEETSGEMAGIDVDRFPTPPSNNAAGFNPLAVSNLQNPDFSTAMSPMSPANMTAFSHHAYTPTLFLPELLAMNFGPGANGNIDPLDRRLVFGGYSLDATTGLSGGQGIMSGLDWDAVASGAQDGSLQGRRTIAKASMNGEAASMVDGAGLSGPKASSAWFMPSNIEPPEMGQDPVSTWVELTLSQECLEEEAVVWQRQMH